MELTIKDQLQEMLEKSKNIGILPSKIAGTDAFCAGVGLFHLLSAQGKNVSFVYPGKRPENTDGLIDESEILSNTSEKELLVSIDYSQSLADRVHYSTENDVLYLSISPVDKNFDLSRVKAELKGFNFDCAICVGSPALSDFGGNYHGLQDELLQTPLINIDHTDMNHRYGKLNLVDSSKESLSQMVLDIATSLNYPLDSKSAKALLCGISVKTK